MSLYAGNARRALTGAEAETGPDAEAARWLSKLEDRAREALIDVRRIVNDLRPPALDELGLAGALRAGTAGLPLAVEVSGDELGPLSAATEVAAYRIALEAVTNASRHAKATQCTVLLHRDDGLLRLEVCDDGQGLPVQRRAGMGMVSMSERATELGGSWQATQRPGGGTLVRATLPTAPQTDR
jgi:signal transduction histidine kinase